MELICLLDILLEGCLAVPQVSDRNTNHELVPARTKVKADLPLIWLVNFWSSGSSTPSRGSIAHRRHSVVECLRLLVLL